MRKNGKKALLLLMLILTGCGRNHKETDAKVIELELDALAEELEATAMIETEELTKSESAPAGVELEPSGVGVA